MLHFDKYECYNLPYVTTCPGLPNNNISFTKELEENNTLPFLDTLIHRTKKNINISVYRKPTHTGLYTHWNSYVPIQFM